MHVWEHHWCTPQSPIKSPVNAQYWTVHVWAPLKHTAFTKKESSKCTVMENARWRAPLMHTAPSLPPRSETVPFARLTRIVGHRLFLVFRLWPMWVVRRVQSRCSLHLQWCPLLLQLPTQLKIRLGAGCVLLRSLASLLVLWLPLGLLLPFASCFFRGTLYRGEVLQLKQVSYKESWMICDLPRIRRGLLSD